MLDADFSVSGPPELVEHLRGLGARYRRAAAGSRRRNLTTPS